MTAAPTASDCKPAVNAAGIGCSAWLGVTVGFKTIVADPPWDMGKTGKRKSRPNQETKLDYPTMDTKSICALEVGQLAAPDSVLFLWATHSHLEAAFGVMRSWGFRYQRCLTWDKANGMCLFGFHHRTEFCLFGYRGKLEAFPRQKAFPTVFGGASERHSAKPETFFELVEAYTTGPRIELFARRGRHGWSSWGNELQSDIVRVTPNDPSSATARL